MENQITYIGLEKIKPSELNPRKTIDKVAISELAESIKQVGLLQPIIIRPNGQKGKYDIVCGERRFRACMEAGKMEIAAIVRELNDDQALDMMITENLQRQDVHPLDESEAYNKLVNLFGYQVDGITSRFGKSESYVRHRIKLKDLIDEFKDIFKQDIIGLGHALELCKLPAATQSEIFEEDFKDRSSTMWDEWHCPSVKELKKNIDRHYSSKLSEATFQLDDKTLDKKAGPCVSCPNNTASDMILFPETRASGICLDRTCFKHKTDIQFDRQLKHVQENEPEVIIGYSSGVYGDEEKKLKDQIKKGLPAIELSYSTGYSEVVKPEPPDEEDKPIESNFEDPEDFKSEMQDYQDQLKDYEDELKEYKEKIASGKLRKAFIVAGRDKGQTLYYEKLQDNNSPNTSAKHGGLDEQQIEELKAKDRRNAELAFEKTYLQVKELVISNSYRKSEEPLTETEMTALYMLMMDRLDDELEKFLFPNNKRNRWVENKDKLPAAKQLNDVHKVRLIRNYLQANLNTGSPGYQISEANALIEIAREKFPDQTAHIELEQQGIYLKRKAKIDQRIEEMKSAQKAN